MPPRFHAIVQYMLRVKLLQLFQASKNFQAMPVPSCLTEHCLKEVHVELVRTGSSLAAGASKFASGVLGAKTSPTLLLAGETPTCLGHPICIPRDVLCERISIAQEQSITLHTSKANWNPISSCFLIITVLALPVLSDICRATLCAVAADLPKCSGANLCPNAWYCLLC